MRDFPKRYDFSAISAHLSQDHKFGYKYKMHPDNVRPPILLLVGYSPTFTFFVNFEAIVPNIELFHLF